MWKLEGWQKQDAELAKARNNCFHLNLLRQAESENASVENCGSVCLVEREHHAKKTNVETDLVGGLTDKKQTPKGKQSQRMKRIQKTFMVKKCVWPKVPASPDDSRQRKHCQRYNRPRVLNPHQRTMGKEDNAFSLRIYWNSTICPKSGYHPMPCSSPLPDWPV